MAAKFESYKDRIGEYRWKLIHTNGQIIADYKANANTLGDMNFVKENTPMATIEDKNA